MKQILFGLLLLSPCMATLAVNAERPSHIPLVEVQPAGLAASTRADSLAHPMVIRGRESSTVIQDEIRLSDIADVSSSLVRDDEAVIAIRKMVVSPSPKPGEELTLSAQQVLTSLRTNGVDLSRVGYLFPRMMRVERAYRTIGVEEVTRALTSFLKQTNREADVKSVSLRREVRVPPRAAHLEIVPLAASRGASHAFQVQVKESGRAVHAFDVHATLNEWKEVPVARRGLTRGEVIEGEDVVMARVNLATLTGDTARSVEDVVGLRLSNDVASGELFKRNRLAIPPLVQTGERVTVMYRSRLLEATTRGVALEAGAEGDMVKVRNENSKKILNGIVTGAGLIEVRS